jgi:signal transduction histidine kinase
MAVSFAVLFSVKADLTMALGSLAQTVAAVAIAWAIGYWSRQRRRYGAALEETARLQEAERVERSRRAVQVERERIAHELHDIVTHHVSVIVIQAGAGLTALDRRPDRSRTALEAIERTGREALADMRRMLGMLGDPSSPEGSREPVPGLDRLGLLIEEVRAAGLPVELSVSGAQRDLDAGIELTAYRVVQESLTNALKHARGARARVRLAYEPETLEVEVRDEGGGGHRDVGEPAASGGRGLIGMRERVAMFHGDFEAGPVAGGFRVHARLPLGAEPSLNT